MISDVLSPGEISPILESPHCILLSKSDFVTYCTHSAQVFSVLFLVKIICVVLKVQRITWIPYVFLSFAGYQSIVASPELLISDGLFLSDAMIALESVRYLPNALFKSNSFVNSLYWKSLFS